MNFNPTKCQVIHVTRLKSLIPSKYFLHNTELESVSAAKYLGVTISEDLRCGKHIDVITKKANQTLVFRHNIKVCSHDLKSTAYKTLMRPQLEYASSVQSTNTIQDKDKIESAQHKAARWATHDYKQTSSVTEMLGNLRWRPLDQSCIDNRLIMLYKSTFDLLAIPVAEYLVPNCRESKFIHPLAYTDKSIQTNPYFYQLL